MCVCVHCVCILSVCGTVHCECAWGGGVCICVEHCDESPALRWEMGERVGVCIVSVCVWGGVCICVEYCEYDVPALRWEMGEELSGMGDEPGSLRGMAAALAAMLATPAAAGEPVAVAKSV